MTAINKKYGSIRKLEDRLSTPHHGPLALLQRFVRKRDFYAGGLMILFGWSWP